MRIYPIDISNNSNSNNIIELGCSNHSLTHNYNFNFNNEDSDNEEVCSICLTQIRSDNLFLHCNHLFHPLCIIRWSKRQIYNKLQPSCPLCKTEYNYHLFSNKIILHHIKFIEYYIEKFKLMLNSGHISYIDRKRIQYLLRKYKNIHSMLTLDKKNNIKHPYNARYFDCFINPPPIDIIRLISTTEKYLEEQKEKVKEKVNLSKNNILLLKKYSNICKNKLFSIINRIII
mgnify:CR=1 FL=1